MKNFNKHLDSFRTRKWLYVRFLCVYCLILLSLALIGLKKWYQQFFHHRDTTEQGLSILVIQLQKIGDLVCTTPVFREIRAQYPHARIIAMVLPFTQGVLTHNPHVDEIIPFDGDSITATLRNEIRFIRQLLRYRFDWSFNFSPNIQNIAYTCLALIPNRVCLKSLYGSRMTRALYWTHSKSLMYNSRTSAAQAYLDTLRFLDIITTETRRDVYLHQGYESLVNTFLQEQGVNGQERLIALHPFAGVKMKEWGDGKFMNLAERLIERYRAKIVLIGAASDWDHAEKIRREAKYPLINSCGQFSLAQLPVLLQRCQMFISVDTGPLYLANAVGVPVVDIAGPSDLQTQSPDGVYEIVQKPLECVPCSFIMHAPRVCKRGDRKCLEIITVDNVLTAIARLETEFIKSEKK